METYFLEIKIPSNSAKLERFVTPALNNYNSLLIYKYTILQLRSICKRYNIKRVSSLNKLQLLKICYNTMRCKYALQIIIKSFRRLFIQRFNETTGPARLCRSLCNNIDDFATTDPINEINYYYFISYQDKDGFIYGYDINTIRTLFEHDNYNNPYTRNHFSHSFLNTVKKRLRYNIIMKKIPIVIIPRHLTSMEKIVTIFQKLDQLGNYTQIEWFTTLSIQRLFVLYRELYDIWVYRAQLSDDMKKNICPPNGDPFVNISPNTIYNMDISERQDIIPFLLVVFHNLIQTGGGVQEHQQMGAFYLLSALTLVSPQAANAMPWLYESVVHVQPIQN